MGQRIEINSRSAVRRPDRKWLFRILALLIAPILFLFAELVCFAFGFGLQEPGDDPFVEFAATRPLFELTTDETKYHTSQPRLGFFRRVEFDRVKPAGEFRVFVLGGSTVQGHPYSIETSFPTYLQTALKHANSSVTPNVINCGGVSYASYRLVPVLTECLNYEPDLVIFCEGHNEFLEDVTYAPVRQQSVIARALGSIAEKSRVIRGLRNSFKSTSAKEALQASSQAAKVREKPVLPEEVDTILNHSGGLTAYHRDDEHASRVVEHFRSNLLRMHQLCSEKSIPLIVVQPPSNLADCPPFRSQFSGNSTEETQKSIVQMLARARELSRSDLNEAIALAKEATRMDPRFALSWYELGQLQLLNHDHDLAKESLRRACDEDVCPLRMTSALTSAMRQTVEELQITFLDADELLRRLSPTGILGDGLLVDHVHPSFRGHEEIAIALAQLMISGGLINSDNDTWPQTAQEACRNRLQALDDLYFLKGQQRLEILRLWAAGRAGDPPQSATSNTE
jgi:lysophospholipase L1-like esterase